jgi:hypothetical protein
VFVAVRGVVAVAVVAVVSPVATEVAVPAFVVSVAVVAALGVSAAVVAEFVVVSAAFVAELVIVSAAFVVEFAVVSPVVGAEVVVSDVVGAELVLVSLAAGAVAAAVVIAGATLSETAVVAVEEPCVASEEGWAEGPRPPHAANSGRTMLSRIAIVLRPHKVAGLPRIHYLITLNTNKGYATTNDSIAFDTANFGRPNRQPSRSTQHASRFRRVLERRERWPWAPIRIENSGGGLLGVASLAPRHREVQVPYENRATHGA